MKKLIVAILFFGSVFHSTNANAAAMASANEAQSGLTGPSVHLFLGVRDTKAPSLDQYYSFLGGFKLSLANLHFGGNSYISILGAGVGFQRDMLFIVNLSPFIVNHASGVGFSFDIYPTSSRADRPGGPFGISLNVDIPQLMKFLAI